MGTSIQRTRRKIIKIMMRITLIMVKEMTTMMGQAGKMAVSWSLRTICHFEVVSPSNCSAAMDEELEWGEACAMVADEQMGTAALGTKCARQRPGGHFTALYSFTRYFTTWTSRSLVTPSRAITGGQNANHALRQIDMGRGVRRALHLGRTVGFRDARKTAQDARIFQVAWTS